MPDLHAMGAKLKHWRENILAFVHENFGVDPDPSQREALEVFASADPAKRRISLQACVGVGKTAVLSWCALHFLGCQGERGEHPKGAAVAITWDNLHDNLVPETAKWMARSRYFSTAFTLTQQRVAANDHADTWFLSWRSWPKTANAEEQGSTLSGLHSKYVLALIDESGAIPLTVLRAAEQALSNCTFGKIVQAGNPISREGMLYAAASQLRHQWHVIRVTGDPDDPKRSPRIELAWAKEQIATYGRENPWVMSYILGQFPPQSLNALLGVEDVEAAMQRHLRPDAYEWAQKRLGIEVARFGDDRTVIFPRQGLASFKPVVMRHGRDSAVSVDIANRVLAAKAKWGSELECFDATGGWAAGAVDVMRANGYSPIDVQFAAPAFDPRFKNRRAEIWFAMSEWLKRGGALPPLPDLVGELVTPTYTFNGGKFQLEDKDQVKRRLGRSPDLADALALTFGMPDMPAAIAGAVGHQSVGKVLHDFDPFEERRR